ncbi:MAG: DNA primase, partial [Sandaracinaceae bacterium]|nr:DNA primase [Sandaracinaceae bacterium]
MDRSLIDSIRDRIDLVELVSGHVMLKRVGSSYRGLCPFHSERTPSFYVHPERKFFYCFGCRASGDAFEFLMRIEGKTFPEVLRALAERAGVVLPEHAGERAGEDRRAREHKKRLLAILERATQFFVQMLKAHPHASRAWEELERRQVREEVVEAYRLGYAPPEGNALARHLSENGVSMADAEEVGLVFSKRGSTWVDRFRHRLIFPVSDSQGQVLGFSGRALSPLPDDEPKGETPKYLNTPDTPLFRKGELLFGLHQARLAMRREGVAILCEGNFDVLAVHKAGFANVVAPLGTAITSEQARLLRRFVPEVIVLFDGDAAGRKALWHAAKVLGEAGLTMRLALLPDGEDPDSFVRAQGEAALAQRLKHSSPLIEFLIESSADEVGRDMRKRIQAIESLGALLYRIVQPVESHLYVQAIGRAFEITDLNIVRQALKRGARQAFAQGEAPLPSPRDPQPSPLPPDPVELEILGAFLDQPHAFSQNMVQELFDLLT